jgi:cob(I)alamin adenosyltransferase
MSIKLYTKTGDKGTTNLYDMRRVGKHSSVFDALGDLDELSAFIGLLCSHNKNPFYRKIQSKLLDVGSNIATKERRTNIVDITEDDIKEVETNIDLLESKNSPLREFILPGVEQADATAQICRAVARRAERNMWKYRKESSNTEFYTGDNIFIFMNRLSDYFFALSRNLSGCREYKRSDVQSK